MMYNKRIIFPILSTSILLILLCLPGLVFFGEQKSLVNVLYAVIVPLAFFILPLVAFHKFIRVYTSVIVILILLAPLATFPVIYFGDLVGKDMILIAFNTTRQEASELIKGYIIWIIIVYTIYVTLIWISVRMLPKKTSLRTSIVLSSAALVLLFSLAIFRSGPRSILHNTKAMLCTYYPFHLAYAIEAFYKQQLDVEKSEKYIRNFPYKDVKTGNLSGRQVYVLIIGETSRFDHWQINGYDRATSPLMMNQPRLLNYEDVSAAGCLTELSVPQILTGVSPETYDMHLHKGGIIQIFHQAGFHTFWISNQTDNGNIGMHADLADSAIWMQNTIASHKHLYYDIDLVNSMKAVLNGDSANCLFVLHTIGSHYDYTDRYPERFEEFKPVFRTEMHRPTDKSSKGELINSYDNTILYTDFVIDSVIHILDNLHCISAMLYTSDHGENLFDDSKNLVLHAPIPPTYYIAHIPFFIYGSKDYTNAFPLKWKNLKNHLNNKLSNNQTFETLADMAGIKFSAQNLHNSIADSTFINSPQKILGPNSKVYLYSQLKSDRNNSTKN